MNLLKYLNPTRLVIGVFNEKNHKCEKRILNIDSINDLGSHWWHKGKHPSHLQTPIELFKY